MIDELLETLRNPALRLERLLLIERGGEGAVNPLAQVAAGDFKSPLADFDSG